MIKIYYLIFTIIIASLSGVSNAKAKSEIKNKEKIFYTCPMHSQIKKPQKGSCPICGMNLTKQRIKGKKSKKAIYACPMHPKETSHKPGKCSKCGMFLKLVKSKKKVKY